MKELQRRAPIRRYFARSLDFFICSLIWNMILLLGLHVNTSGFNIIEGILNTAIVLVIMLLTEAVLLSKVGTTLGKWILGLRVTNADGKRLTFTEAFCRTWYVIVHGMGFDLPFYSIYCKWKSYKECENGAVLEWEYDSEIVLRDEKKWRIVFYIVVNVFFILLQYLVIGVTALPENRGEISVKDYSVNYNQLAKYYDVWSLGYLDETGQWEAKTEDEYGREVIVYLSEEVYPEIHYIEENGVMQGLSFSGGEGWSSFYENEIVLSMQAFVYAKEPRCVFTTEVYEICDEITSRPEDELHFEIDGVKINYIGGTDNFTFEMKIDE